MLKPDRSIDPVTDISYFMNQVAEAGGFVTNVTGTFGLGASMDDAANFVGYLPEASVSGKQAVGMLMQNTVDIDQTRQTVNYAKDEVQVGNKVVVWRQGFATTNMFTANSATGTLFPINGYLAGDGKIVANGANYTVVSGYPLVCRVMSRVDGDGYAKVYITL